MAYKSSKNVSLPSSLFDGFINFFPFRLKGRNFYLSSTHLLFYTVFLLLFAAISFINLYYASIPRNFTTQKCALFFASFGFISSLAICLYGLFLNRNIVDLPFLHLEFALTYLQAVGLFPTVKCPFYVYIGPYLLPLFLATPYSLVMKVNVFSIISFFSDYIMIQFFFQLLFKVIGFLRVLDQVLIYCENSLKYSGDGIYYIGKTEKIEYLVFAFNHLCSSCVFTSEVFSMCFLTFISTAFVGTTVALYITVLATFSPWPATFKHHVIISKMLELITYSVTTWHLVAVCVSCSDKIKEFKGLLYKLMIDDRTNEILRNKKLRHQILMKHEVLFTAANFFTLDYSLIHSMIATSTTYLVILIQFTAASTN